MDNVKWLATAMAPMEETPQEHETRTAANFPSVEEALSTDKRYATLLEMNKIDAVTGRSQALRV